MEYILSTDVDYHAFIFCRLRVCSVTSEVSKSDNIIEFLACDESPQKLIAQLFFTMLGK